MPNGYMKLLAEETAARTFTVDGPLKSITFDFLGREWVVSESVVVQWVVMVVLAIFFFVLGRNLKVKPTSRRQMIAEYIVGTFTGQFADAINKACGIPVAICDNDTVVAVSGVPKKDLLEKPISQTLYETMGRRQSYSATPDGTFSLEVAENSGSHVSFMSPIVAEGNVIGAVMSLQKQNGQSPDEAEKKLISTGAMFLSSQMEV